MDGKTFVHPDEEIERARTKEETDKKCPSCGGVMDFNPATGGLRCQYCGFATDIESAGAVTELDFESAENMENCDWGAEKKTVLCKACGAESIYDALEISNECPYCGSNQVMEEKGKNSLAPGGVCVFRLDAIQAAENFHTWLKKKWFTPRIAKQKSQPDTFHGVYLPYWTFDSDTTSQYTARYGIDRTVRDSKGNTTVITDWYPTSGIYAEFIDDQLVLGTTRHDSALMSRIEPFNTADNKAYKPEYIAGFISERYSIGLKNAWELAKQAIANTLKSNISQMIRRERHADHVDSLRIQTQHRNVGYKYLLLPVWLSSFAYKGKIFQFMVNGQTGKVGGKAPVSVLRVLLALLIGLLLIWLLYQITNA